MDSSTSAFDAPPSPKVDTRPSVAAGRRARTNGARSSAHPRIAATPRGFILAYLRRRPWMFAGLFALVVAAASCAVGVQYGMKLIVDTMAGDDRASRAIWISLALFIALIAMEAIVWRLAGWLGCHAVVETGVDVRLDLFRHLSGHSPSYLSTHLVGSLGSRVTATAGATASVLQTAIWKIAPPVVDFIGAVIVITTIDGRMSLALIASVSVVALVMARFGIRARPLQQRFAKAAARISGQLIDVIANVWTMQAFSARDRELGRLGISCATEAKAQRDSWLYLERARAVHDLCMVVLAGGMLIWVVESWRAGHRQAGDVVLVSALTFRILHGSRDLALALVDGSQQLGVIADMLRIVAVEHDIAERPAAPAFQPGRGEIRFDGVSFAYQDRPPLFHDLHLVIPAGQRFGIVGPSGAGKTTLVKLIERVADAHAGRVCIDGQCIRDVGKDTLRAAIAVVPQDVALFHRSVMDNLRYGRPDATDDEVRAAARTALCDDFIERLPQGYETIVGERGTRLSGGQRQRIGIARALLKDAPILLLDEATSALDSRSEVEIQPALLDLMAGRTVVAVAHRLSTVSTFDRVAVLIDGRFAEDGPPDVLRDAGGVYAQMWRLQAEGFDRADR